MKTDNSFCHFPKADKSTDEGESSGGVEGRLNSARIEYYLKQSRHNIDSDTAILGSTGKYDVIGKTKDIHSKKYVKAYGKQ